MIHDRLDVANGRLEAEVRDLKKRLSELEAENAFLRTQWQEGGYGMFTKADKERLTAENQRLREALRDAIDGYVECAGYKGEYLYNKHRDAEDIAKLKAVLEGE